MNDLGFRATASVRGRRFDRGRWRLAARAGGDTIIGLLIAVLSAGLVWLVWIYGNALHDPRYLDGWILAGGMGLQIGYHVALKLARHSPRASARWRGNHIIIGFLLIAAFASHSAFSLPDTGLEWALWTCFVLVTLSGVFGTYLARSPPSIAGIEPGSGQDRIAARRLELSRKLHATVAMTAHDRAEALLPAPPQDAWILDLYIYHLRDFVEGPRNFASHLIHSRRPLDRLTHEIDGLTSYVDARGREKLAVIRALVVEKDRLDFAHAHVALTKGWLFVHVPATYALIVLAVLHILVAYAFSSGGW